MANAADYDTGIVNRESNGGDVSCMRRDTALNYVISNNCPFGSRSSTAACADGNSYGAGAIEKSKGTA